MALDIKPAPAAADSSLLGEFVADSVSDVLVFERNESGFGLIGGRGRGTGWAGIVEVPDSEQSLVAKAWTAGMPARLSGSRPQQAVGPYHAMHAVAVPVGDRHVVVLGSNLPIEVTDSEAVRYAATVVDRTHGVPADKLLADELELVQTLRSLMAYQPTNVRDTLRHIATVAAGALSCEVAIARIEHSGQQIVEAIGLPQPAVAALETIDGHGPPFETERDDARVDQVAPPGWARLGADLSSSISLPIGVSPMRGVLSLGHATTRPRGFTSLCQRIGRAVAESAELLISQAIAREQLATERDLLVRVSGTDQLTGLANRRAWDEEAERMSNQQEQACGFVLSCDLDNLKHANDAFGHAVGDALIRGAANVLQSSVRSTDLVARIGGDEFGVLLLGANARTAARIRSRIRRASGQWKVSQHELSPHMSVGIAEIRDRDVDGALRAADARMYVDKRSRARATALTSAQRPAGAG